MNLKSVMLWLAAAAMPTAVSSQEVFVPNAQGDITPLTKAVVTGQKTGGASLLAAYGAKLTTSMIIDGKYSAVVLPKMSTVFYVFCPKNIPAQSWRMVRLKTKKDHRELPYMKTSAYSGSRTKLEDVQLASTKIADEVYEFRAVGEFKDGEYAFFRIDNGIPADIFDFRVQGNLPPHPGVSQDVIMAEFNPGSSMPEESDRGLADNAGSDPILRWYFDSDPRGARIFYRIISGVPSEVKNTNESYMTTTPLEETKALHVPGLNYRNAADVVIEIKVTKRGFEEQVKRYNLRQALDQQEISGFFELVEKEPAGRIR